MSEFTAAEQEPASLSGEGDDALIDASALDATALSALLASRLCHDLINPVGALGSGLEVLDEEDLDEGMREAALDLIRTGGAKSISLLKYARLAYGAAGGRGAEIPMDEAGEIMKDLYQWSKAELEWTAPPLHALKEIVKSVMIMTQYAGDCVPRGGAVCVRKEAADYYIDVEGKRALLQDDLGAALNGDTHEMKPKFAPAYLVGLMVRSLGGSASVARQTEEKIRFHLHFPGQ